MSDQPKEQIIREVVQKACASAKRMRTRKFRNEAVNWADFGPTEIKTKTVVTCSEADPNAWKVANHIRERLASAGYSGDDVEVVLEW